MPNSSPPLLRNFVRNEVDIVRVNVGRVAVDSELMLNNIFITRKDAPREKLPDKEDASYLGVVDINHSDMPADEKELNELDSIEQKDREPDTSEPLDEKIEKVSNKYIPSKPYEPTGDEPYPNESPLLAPN